MTKITDAVQMGDAAIDAAGYLQANARTARTGVQQYLGRELGRPDLDVVSVYRDEADVFSKRSLDTFSRLPITNDHPGVDVDATNWKDLAVGTTGDDVLRDGEYLKIGLKITDASAVKAVKDGKRELSVGYSAEIEWHDGVAPDGTPYQARQKNIVANHVAIVQKGRAGAKARIGDAWGASPIQDFQPGASPKTVEEGRMTDSLKTVVLGDKAVQVAVTDVAAIEQYKATMNQALADADAAKKKVEEEKDEEIGKLKADLKKAEDAAKIDVDALVASRADLLGKVKALDAAIDPKGKTDAELRKAAVASRMGDEAVKDASDAEVAGMFKALTRDAKPVNPVAGVIADGARVTTNDGWADAVASSGVKMKKEG